MAINVSQDEFDAIAVGDAFTGYNGRPMTVARVGEARVWRFPDRVLKVRWIEVYGLSAQHTIGFTIETSIG